MTSTLSFEITCSAITLPAEPGSENAKPFHYVGTRVTPHVNGQQLMVNARWPVFDALALFMHGEAPSTFDLYTCSCGAAGCTGIFDEFSLDSDDSTVCWTFGEDYFRKQLNTALLPADQPLKVVFDKAQYLEAVAGLRAELIELDNKWELPVLVVVTDFPEAHLDRTVQQTIEKCEEWFRDECAEEADRLVRYGELLNLGVRAEFADGKSFIASVSQVVDAIADVRLPHEYEEQVMLVKEVLVPALREDVTRLLDWARELTWFGLGYAFYPDEENGIGEDDDARAIREPQWPEAKLNIVAFTG